MANFICIFGMGKEDRSTNEKSVSLSITLIYKLHRGTNNINVVHCNQANSTLALLVIPQKNYFVSHAGNKLKSMKYKKSGILL